MKVPRWQQCWTVSEVALHQIILKFYWFFSTSPNDKKVQRLQEHVNEVSNIMQQNIDKIIERGSNLDCLENRSEFLSNHSNEFRVGARRIQRKMWWQNMKVNLIIGLVILVIVIIIIGKWHTALATNYKIYFIYSFNDIKVRREQFM